MRYHPNHISAATQYPTWGRFALSLLLLCLYPVFGFAVIIF
jgi:hypothetical protein